LLVIVEAADQLFGVLIGVEEVVDLLSREARAAVADDLRAGIAAAATRLDEIADRRAVEDALPALPWFPVRGDRDASTLWYAVMRKETKGVYIGTLVIRHSDHHASLLEGGWQEVPPEAIDGGEAGVAPGPWTAH